MTEFDAKQLALIGRVYDAALDSEQWNTIAPIMARAFDSTSAIVQIRDGKGDPRLLSKTANFSDWALSSYQQYYYQRDELVARGAVCARDKVIHGYELIDDASFQQTEIYNDYCKKVSIHHVLGGICSLTNNSVGIIGIHRERNASRFTEQDRRRLDHIFNHLRRALILSATISSAQQKHSANVTALDTLGIGVVLARSDGTVVYANVAAENVLTSGRALTLSMGRLRAVSGAGSAALHQRITEAVMIAGGEPLAISDPLGLAGADGLPIFVLACPIGSNTSVLGASGPLAMLLIHDPAASGKLSADTMVKFFGLTPAEAVLLSALCEGDRLADFAERKGISLATAKTQLRQIFDKLGCHRQADLISTAGGDPLLRMAATLERR